MCGGDPCEEKKTTSPALLGPRAGRQGGARSGSQDGTMEAYETGPLQFPQRVLEGALAKPREWTQEQKSPSLGPRRENQKAGAGGFASDH